MGFFSKVKKSVKKAGESIKSAATSKTGKLVVGAALGATALGVGAVIAKKALSKPKPGASLTSGASGGGTSGYSGRKSRSKNTILKRKIKNEYYKKAEIEVAKGNPGKANQHRTAAIAVR